VVPPPDPAAAAPCSPRADDWSALKPVARGAAPSAADANDDSDGGIRREPTLPEHEQIAPEPGPPPAKEFDFMEDEQDDDVVRTRTLAARARRVARQAALDPDDGIAL
jgi:type IV secretion system protein VirD4